MESGEIIRKALTPEQAKQMQEIIKNAPKAAAFEHAELKQTKEADGSTSFSLSFRQSFKDRLLLAISLLRNKVTPEEAATLTEQHAFIRDTVEAFQLQPEEDGRRTLRTYPKPELLDGEGAAAAYRARLNEILSAELIQGAIRQLFYELEKTQKTRRKKTTEGIGYAAGVLLSKPYIEQQLQTERRKKAAQQRLPFDEAKDYAKKTGIELKPDEERAAANFQQYGIALTVAQDHAVKALLSAFTSTDYKGNAEPQPVTDLLPKYADSIDYINPAEDLLAWKNIGSTVPRLRFTRAEYLRLYGIERQDGTASSQSKIAEALDALQFVSTRQWVFYWERPKTERQVITQKGGRKKYAYTVIRNTDGSPQMEEVRETGTLFRLLEVKDKDKPDQLAYYEITPAAVVLDMLRSGTKGMKSYVYYPLELERQAVKNTKKKRLSKIEGKLLLWLAYQFEEKRRNRKSLEGWGNEAALAKKGPQDLIRIDWKELAAELNEPESQIKKKPKQVYKRLQAAYEIAVKANFLTKFEREGTGIDSLYFNPEAFQQTAQQLTK